MFLVRGSVAALAAQVAGNRLVPRLTEQFRFRFGYNPSQSEVRSWDRSIPALLDQLAEAGLGEVEVLIEYQLPLTSKRADVVLIGEHPRGGPSCVVVENKQWSALELVYVQYLLVQVAGGFGMQERLHPQEQVRRYVEYLQDFNRYLGDHPGSLAGCVFMHNASSASIAGLRDPDLADLSFFPAFAANELADLRAFLTSRLAPTSGIRFADDFLSSRIAPSKQLLRHVQQEIAANPQFTLLDEQQVAYQVVLRTVQNARRADAKEVVLVTGGPGSGKSVIAIALLASLAKQGYNVSHATGSRSFTTTLRQVVGKRVRRVKEVFRYTNNFMDTERNSLDVLIVDEAHRIRATSTNRFTRAAKRDGTPQADELVQAARVPVFLLDEHQVVRPDEIGTVASIEQAAAANGGVVRRIDLNGQFRCGGSPVYVRWVEELLGLLPSGPKPWQPDDAFELFLADSPDQMEWELHGKVDQGYVARMAAGYCWPWSKPRLDGTLVDDVTIGSWRRPWNLLSDRPLGGIPPSALWATEDAGFGQVGCVYTAQGFEYEYSGVIIGGDLVWRDDHWETRPTVSCDRDIKRASNSDALIRNVYKVLLTRGLRGCIIYAVDYETRQMLAGLGIPPLQAANG
jgi:hypothetical protein